MLAYGATGAGKTHTMLGSTTDPGVMYLTMLDLYKSMDEIKEEKICSTAVSYLEVSWHYHFYRLITVFEKSLNNTDVSHECEKSLKYLILNVFLCMLLFFWVFFSSSSFFGTISDSQRSCKNSTKNFQIPFIHQDLPYVNILPHLLSLSVCMHLFFFKTV